MDIMTAARHQVFRGAIEDLIAEREAQLKRWGDQTHRAGVHPSYRYPLDTFRRLAGSSDPSWAAILGEEVFEALTTEDPAACERELIQVAAVAMAWIEDLRRGGGWE